MENPVGDLEIGYGYIFLVLAMFILSFSTGFFLGQPTRNDTEFQTNLTLSSDSDTAELEFDGKSVDVFHESGESASFYLDLDQDGSAEFRIGELERDGEVHESSELFTLENETYGIYYRYRDNSTTEDDEWLYIYRVKKF